MKRIPKSFQMGPHTITVSVLSDTDLQKVAAADGLPGCDGLCDYEGYTIYVRRIGKKFPKRSQMHAFWHEYFHMLFHCVGRERLARDETLVDNCGAMHLQAIQTAEF